MRYDNNYAVENLYNQFRSERRIDYVMNTSTVRYVVHTVRFVALKYSVDEWEVYVEINVSQRRELTVYRRSTLLPTLRVEKEGERK